MAKYPLTLSVDREDYEVIKKMCEVMGITQAKLFESTIKGFVFTAKASGLLLQDKAKAQDLLNFFTKGQEYEIK